MGRYKIPVSYIEHQNQFQPNERREVFVRNFAVHQNRIEFIVVNWISLFIVFFFSSMLLTKALTQTHIYVKRINSHEPVGDSS